MRKSFKRILTVALALVTVLGCLTIGAVAASNNETIQALLSYSTPIKYNGEVQTFTDVHGNRVYPILYQGTTYLPVRAVCNMLGIDVDWDAATGTVVLGAKEEAPVEPAGADRTYVEGWMLGSEAGYGVSGGWSTDKSALTVGGKEYEYGLYGVWKAYSQCVTTRDLLDYSLPDIKMDK